MTPVTPACLHLPEDHLGLYVHVPFCVRKCHYCDFASQPLATAPRLPDAYLEALAREAAQRRAEVHAPLHSIYLGGGTPTALTGAQLRRLWREVVEPFPRLPDAEITLEANPGTLNEEMLAAIAELPLTRVSLGVQSFLPAELALLGRAHSARDAEDAVRALRAAGIPRLNLDLIYGLPAQTAVGWTETLARALSLQPDHLSLYALSLEEGTPLAVRVDAGELTLPGEEEEEAMQEAATAATAAEGYLRYEVSNYALPGAHSRHNLGYWRGRDYLGLGAAATSTLAGVRWRNVEDAAAYAARMAADVSPLAYVERLSAPARLAERVMLGLRLREGFPLPEAEAACGYTLHAWAGETPAALAAEGLLEEAGGVLRLTAAGYRIANAVTARLMAAGDRESARERRKKVCADLV